MSNKLLGDADVPGSRVTLGEPVSLSILRFRAQPLCARHLLGACRAAEEVAPKAPDLLKLSIW